VELTKLTKQVLSACLLLLPLMILILSAIGKYDETFSWYAGFVLLIFLVLCFGLKTLDVHLKHMVYENISTAIWIPLGAVVCYSLSIYAGLGNVIGAGITGTVASFLPNINKQSTYLKKLPSAIYCGAFVGMSSGVILSSLGWVLLAGVMASVFYILTKSVFVGLGGKLGTMAFGGVVSVSFLIWLFL